MIIISQQWEYVRQTKASNKQKQREIMLCSLSSVLSIRDKQQIICSKNFSLPGNKNYNYVIKITTEVVHRIEKSLKVFVMDYDVICEASPGINFNITSWLREMLSRRCVERSYKFSLFRNFWNYILNSFISGY